MAKEKKEPKEEPTVVDRTPEETAAMLKKGAMIQAKLEELYPVAPEGFLDHKDPFTLLVAVVLSAQCLDSTVNAVTPALFAAADTPAKMRDLGAARIQELIARIGLSKSKAKYLAGLSEALCANHGGAVPATLAELERLPGVGHKTASVVLIQAFGEPAFPVDTHIHRLACRWGAGHAKSVARTEAALKTWFPDPHSWAGLHTRMIAFGRAHCPARAHDMEACPVCAFAATAEARAANLASPRRFVAPSAHRHPYSTRPAPVGTPPPGPPARHPPETEPARHVVKKARMTPPAHAPPHPAPAHSPPLAQPPDDAPHTTHQSSAPPRPDMKGEGADKKAPAKKGRGIAKPAAPPKKPGRPKGSTKGSKPKEEKPEPAKGLRRSERIANQK